MELEWITCSSPTASPSQSEEEDTSLKLGGVEECVDEDDNEIESD